MAILIQPDQQIQYKKLPSLAPNADAATLKADFLENGLWALIKQRPFDTIADPQITPLAIFVSAFDSHPLAPKSDLILEGNQDYVQLGLTALAQFAKVHLSIHKIHNSSPFFLQLKNVDLHVFEGPHPSGNVGVQMHHIRPLNKGEVYWSLGLWELIALGRRLKDNQFNLSRYIALVGSQVKDTAYVETLPGAKISSIVGENNVYDPQNVRYISGNPLTGKKVDRNGFLGFYQRGISPNFFSQKAG